MRLTPSPHRLKTWGMARSLSEMRRWVEEAETAVLEAEKAGLERRDRYAMHRLRVAYYMRRKMLQNAERAPFRQYELPVAV